MQTPPSLESSPAIWIPAKRGCGFSLVEVVVALGILSFGILGVTAGQIMAMKSGAASRDQTLAMYVAQQQMEIFQTMSGADVTAMIADPGYPNDPDNPIDPDPGDGTAMQFNRSWSIQPDTPEVGIITIRVDVVWTDPLGVVRTASVESLKAGT